MTHSNQNGSDSSERPPPDRQSVDRLDAEDRVARWQRDLKDLLNRLEPYLVAGRIVTFEHIHTEEKTFYASILHTVPVPESVCAIFIPPSVIQQAMWPGNRAAAADQNAELYGIAPDAGAVVAIRCGSLKTIVNALFALPPLTPGIDVYEDGRLLSGYTFNDHRECADGLADALQTYLQ